MVLYVCHKTYAVSDCEMPSVKRRNSFVPHSSSSYRYPSSIERAKHRRTSSDLSYDPCLATEEYVLHRHIVVCIYINANVRWYTCGTFVSATPPHLIAIGTQKSKHTSYSYFLKILYFELTDESKGCV